MKSLLLLGGLGAEDVLAGCGVEQVEKEVVGVGRCAIYYAACEKSMSGSTVVVV
jgi:hypothetical protein